MSPFDCKPAAARNARVLLIGRSPEVMETVLAELREFDVTAEGSTDPDLATDRFDPRDFDLLVLGHGMPKALRRAIGARFKERNPQLRLLEVFASSAVHDIIRALDDASEAPLVDLDAYFARIGYRGSRTPTLETLRALQELHPAVITFEALDVLVGRPVDISPSAVDAKLILARRGGYCYEQNGLFKRVLTALGFEVDALAARVRWLEPAGAPPRPRTHMALRVTVNDIAYLVDVGFGSVLPTTPLRLDESEPQPTRHETFRILPYGPSLLLQARLGDKWAPLYELSQDPQLDVDYELANWFTATHPSSLFRNTLMVARSAPEARHALFDGRLTTRLPDGIMERKFLDADGIERALAEVFDLPLDPTWRPALEQAAARTMAT